MKSNTKRCLFGGALFAAGLAGQASADGFDWANPTYDVEQYGFVYSYAAGTYFHQYFAPGGPYTTQPVSSFATTEISSFLISAEFVSNNYPAGASAFGFFTVDSPVDVKVTWDFDELFAAGDQQTYLYDQTNNNVLLSSNGATDSGMLTFALVPGRLYFASVDAGAGRGVSSSVSMMIPAPGVGMCLGALGLGALRRRRRG